MSAVAIVGSRDYPKLGRVRAFVRSLKAGTVVISGGAGGVDTTAILEARARGLECRVHTPDWTHFGKRAGAIRNRQIVAEADLVIAFWDGQSPGTRITVEMAREMGKPLEIVRP